jgi:hypothetical protein
MRTSTLASVMGLGLLGCNAIFGITEGTLDDGSGGNGNGGDANGGNGTGGAPQGGGGASTDGGGGATTDGGGGSGGGGVVGCDPEALGPGESLPSTCGVFVNFSAPPGDGTQASPFSSLTDAFGAGNPDQKDVYICGNPTVVGSFTLTAGIDVFGGLHCDAWERDATASPEIVGDNTSGGSATLTIQGAGSTRLQRIHLIAIDQLPNVIAPSSIGLFVKEADVQLNLVRISTGRGGDGQAGADGNPGADGNNGTPPSSNCPSTAAPGGLGSCGATSVRGGAGSLCNAAVNTTGEDGQNNVSPFGSGGSYSGSTCVAANVGATGSPGTQSVPNSGRGLLTNLGFIPAISTMMAQEGAPGRWRRRWRRALRQRRRRRRRRRLRRASRREWSLGWLELRDRRHPRQLWPPTRLWGLCHDHQLRAPRWERWSRRRGGAWGASAVRAGQAPTGSRVASAARVRTEGRAGPAATQAAAPAVIRSSWATTTSPPWSSTARRSPTAPRPAPGQAGAASSPPSPAPTGGSVRAGFWDENDQMHCYNAMGQEI